MESDYPCLSKYIKQCIENCNVLPIPCPDLRCRVHGHLTQAEVKLLLVASELQPDITTTGTTITAGLNENKGSSDTPHLYAKYLKICENIEILRDPNRVHCPVPSCQSVCQFESKGSSVQVVCSECAHRFCSRCFKRWPDDTDLDINNNEQAVLSVAASSSVCNCAKAAALSSGAKFTKDIDCERQVLIDSTSSLSDFKNIKRCPKCTIPIERAEGCAQIMCKFCRHTFCFYCLESLENDFLLKHYTKDGPCKGKLGHSRLSIFFHRMSVVGIFAGTVVLMIILSPFLLLTLPCLIFSDKCRKTCFKFSTKFG